MLTAAAMLAAVISCSKNIEAEAPVAEPAEDAVPEGLVKIVISADLSGVAQPGDAQGAASRATLEGGTVKWSAGDKIAVHDGTALRQFDLTAGEGTASGTFEGLVDSGADALKALFPYEAASWGGSDFTYNIPDFQDVASQSIDPQALIAVGTGSVSGGLTFSNAPSLLRFTVGAGVTQVIFHTLDGEKIAGNSTSVVVALPGDAGTYEAAINPGTYAGFRAFVTNGSGTFMKESATPLTLAASKGKNMGTLAPAEQVIAIATPAELEAFLGGSPAYDAYLCKDLDLSAANPGTLASYANAFDGQGHELKNWAADAALFGTLSGSISNLTIGASCTMGDPAPGNFGYLVKELTGSMTACVNRANIDVTLSDVSSSYIFGSLVGCSNAADAVMTDCENYGSIEIDFAVPDAGTMEPQFLGGLVGKVGTESTESTTRMDGCVNHGDHLSVDVASGAVSQAITMVGGVAGAVGVTAGDADHKTDYTLCYGKLNACVNYADVSVDYAGGTGQGFKVGGVIGTAECVLAGCENNGDVSFANAADVTNNAPAIGGIAGALCGPSTGHNAQDCINRGAVSVSGQFGNGSAITYLAGCGGTYYCVAGGCFGISGDRTTSLSNCDNYGHLNFAINGLVSNGSTANYGGVVGRCWASLSGCDNLYNGVSPQIMSSEGIETVYMGGVVGYAYKNCTGISSCTNTASISSVRHNKGAGTVALTSGFGGIAGVNSTGTAVSNCSNSGNISYTHNDVSSGGFTVGGIVAVNTPATTFTSCANTGDVSVSTTEDSANDNYVAGVVGRTTGTATLTGCSNEGAVSFNGQSSSSEKSNYVAGVVSFTGTHSSSLTNCTNEGSLLYDGGNVTSSTNIWVAGVAGYVTVNKSAGSGFVIRNCSNSGSITARNWNCSRMSYVGGVFGGGYGQPATTNVFDDNTNTGNITVNSGSVLHVGGVVGSLRGPAKGCVQNADITVSGTGLTKVGGLIGYYYSGSLSDSDTPRHSSCTGVITTDCGVSSFTGGISGTEQYSVSYSNFTLNAQIYAATGAVGALIGGIKNHAGENVKRTVTISGTNTYTGTTVNGANIAAGNLVGDKGTGTLSQTDF